MPDTEIRKIVVFCKALPSCFLITFGFATVSQKYKKIRCPCSKVMTGWSNEYGLESTGYPRPHRYTRRGMYQRVSTMGIYCVYHTAIKVCLKQLYCNDEKI